MNVIAAIHETARLAMEVKASKDLLPPSRINEALFNHPSLGYEHIVEMYNRAITEDMSEAKLNRWLGWMQCAICTWTEAVSVEDMKAINASHA